MEFEDKSGVLRAQFEHQSQHFAGQCPDYGVNSGFDGEAVESLSTGRRLGSPTDPASSEGMTSDPDAAWGCHRQYRTDAIGREQVTENF